MAWTLLITSISILLYSLYWSYRMKRIMDFERYGLQWTLATALVVLFTVAFCSLLFLEEDVIKHTLLVDWILLGGSAYVCLVMYTGYLTTRDLSKTTISKKYLTRILNSTSSGLIVCEPDFTINLVNKWLCRAGGWSEHQLTGNHVKNLLKEWERLAKALRNGDPIQNFETCMLARNGDKVPILLSCSKVRNRNGDITAYTFEAQDILLKKYEVAVNSLEQTQNKLKHSEKELRTLSMVASHTSNAVVITCANGLVEWVNMGFTKLTGYQLSEVKGMKPSAFLQGEETDLNTVARISKHLKNGHYVDEEIINYTKAGEKYWLRLIINPVFDDNGELVNFVAIESDITKSKEIEEELIHARDSAEASQRAKDQFLASMSHEIRTPLNGIMGFTELLIKSRINKKQREFLDAIKNSSDNLLVIINDILDFSKIESGKIELEEIAFRLTELIDNTTKSFTFKAEEKGILLEQSVDKNIPELLDGDPVRINQVITNLLGNAMKFTENGKVQLSVKLKKIDSEQAHLLFCVADSGIGISPEKLEMVFDSFTQASASTTRKFGGTGLGLAIVKRLVNLMGGDIWAESELGKGSKFFFAMPLKVSVSEGIKESEPMEKTDLTGLKVLVAEDYKINQLLIKAILDGWGIASDIVINGKIAVEEVEKKDYDLVLMDINMPEMSGYEATELIRSELTAPKNEIPIIALTASAIKGEREKCLSIGMDHYVTKPVKPDLLNAAICEVLMCQKAEG
ncbi:MAG: ATP-binding protein [Bacteroidota bacterium]